MKIAIKTLGCKSNRYESDSIYEILRPDFEVYEVNEGASSFAKKSDQQADLLIVNSCTVTHVADRKSRQAIRSFKRFNPDSKVAVFGCSSNIHPDQYDNMIEVDFRADNSKDIVKYSRDLAASIQQDNICNYQYHDGQGIRTRALVKIQDGCNNFCSYCIIPFARGPEYSFSSKEILRQVKSKELQGYKEIVLTGINIGEWRDDNMNTTGLIKFLIQETSTIRFRISSIEPKNFSRKFYELFQTGRLCKHMHMSLQSGSDSVLKRMRRNYDTKFFSNICNSFREVCPDISLTTDVIVGFPGESDSEFKETLDYLKSIQFSRIHVFPYSKRKNTAAYLMKGQIDNKTKKERSKILRNLSMKFELNFWNSLLGSTSELLIEEIDDDYYKGRSSNYIPIKIPIEKFSCSINEIVKVKLLKVHDNTFVEGIVI
ncbi:tRNA (N(6)-L-threonylcarbamoyladenosine(37)-C(2))-methylthiotransferase MtaB [Patescibacteria group bacterium]